MRVRRIIPWYGFGQGGETYSIEIAEQPLVRAIISVLYEVYYRRLGWIVRGLEPLNRYLHEHTCRLCRAAALGEDTEGFYESTGLLYNIHYWPLCARQDERSFDLDHKRRDPIVRFETDEATYQRLAEGGCMLARAPRRLERKFREQDKGER